MLWITVVGLCALMAHPSLAQEEPPSVSTIEMTLSFRKQGQTSVLTQDETDTFTISVPHGLELNDIKRKVRGTISDRDSIETIINYEKGILAVLTQQAHACYIFTLDKDDANADLSKRESLIKYMAGTNKKMEFTTLSEEQRNFDMVQKTDYTVDDLGETILRKCQKKYGYKKFYKMEQILPATGKRELTESNAVSDEKRCQRKIVVQCERACSLLQIPKCLRHIWWRDGCLVPSKERDVFCRTYCIERMVCL